MKMLHRKSCPLTCCSGMVHESVDHENVVDMVFFYHNINSPFKISGKISVHRKHISVKE